MINNTSIYIGIAVMALVTYLIRMLPMAIFKKKIKNKYILSFLHYMPYAVLGAMTFPAILYSTSNIYSAAVGLIAAVILALGRKSLVTVALVSSVAVFITEALI